MLRHQNPLQQSNLPEEVFCLLQGFGIKPGDCLLVHSGFKQLGFAGSALERQEMAHDLWQSFQEYLTREGTLLAPALSHEYVGENNPVFHSQLTRSCTGYLSELFRTEYATGRSLHPTHSVSGWGAHLDYYLGDHIQDSTPVGPCSPFTRLSEPAGSQSVYIMFLGCSTNSNTSVHGIEELVEPDYLFDGCYQAAVIDDDNQVRLQEYRAHGFRGVLQEYSRLEHLLPTTCWSRKDFFACSVKVIQAERLWECTLPILKKNPRALVQSIS
jgi:aminoglycoside 3-N-acetyltransferase